LLAACRELLDAAPVFVLLNVYRTVITKGRAEDEAQQLCAGLQKMLNRFRANVCSGELALEDGAQHRISASVFARAEFDH